MGKLRIVIPLLCRSKKNCQRFTYNKYNKRTYLLQSDLYLQFERDCGIFLRKYERHISTPINLKCTFIVPNKRKRDLCNLLEAIQDILVKYGVLEDDNSNIVAGVDGSRVIFEKDREMTIIEIEEIRS